MVKASHPIVVEKVHEQVAFEVGWPQRAHVRFWHIPDVQTALMNVRFERT
jgi:hypothetical protein